MKTLRMVKGFLEDGIGEAKKRREGEKGGGECAKLWNSTQKGREVPFVAAKMQIIGDGHYIYIQVLGFYRPCNGKTGLNWCFSLF